jgi:hypothetical protein
MWNFHPACPCSADELDLQLQQQKQFGSTITKLHLSRSRAKVLLFSASPIFIEEISP